MSPIAQPTHLRKRQSLPRREELIEKVKARMSVPRVQMTLLLALTGGAGFLSSYALLQLGMHDMALRYPLAVGIAYLVFFLLLRLWISFQSDPAEYAHDAVDLGLESMDGVASLAGEPAVPAPRPVPRPQASSSFDIGFPDLDEGAVVVFLIALAAVATVVLGLVAYVIYLAPLLLAEVLVDGVILVGLYKRLKGPEPEYWMFGAIRRTWIAAVLVAVTFFFAGVTFQSLAPEARSIGGVWKTVSSDQP